MEIQSGAFYQQIDSSLIRLRGQPLLFEDDLILKMI